MNSGSNVKISVRNLVEFTLRAGDLDTRFTTSSRAVEGTRLQQKLQKLNKKKFMKIIMNFTGPRLRVMVIFMACNSS